jgi:branched-chain amino acid transport system permease protein
MVIGGLASIPGALYGALFVQFVPNVADQLSKAAPWALYGVMMIAFMYVMPGGIAGAVRWLRAKSTRYPVVTTKAGSP